MLLIIYYNKFTVMNYKILLSNKELELLRKAVIESKFAPYFTINSISREDKLMDVNIIIEDVGINMFQLLAGFLIYVGEQKAKEYAIQGN